MKKLFLVCGWLLFLEAQIVDPSLPWLLKTPAEIENMLDVMAQQPPYSV